MEESLKKTFCYVIYEKMMHEPLFVDFMWKVYLRTDEEREYLLKQIEKREESA